MNDSTRGLRVIVSLAIILCIVASLKGASGEDKNAGALRIATIDVDRISSEYKVLKSFKQEVDKRKETVKIQAQISQQNPLLTEAEQKTLADLSFKDKGGAAGGPALTPAEKTSQTTLVEKSRKLLEDFQRLQGTAIGVATDQDKAKLIEYQKLGTETENRVNTLTQQADAELTGKYNELMAQTQKNLHDTLRTVAKEKQYTLVLSSGVAPYAEFDCTDDVIKLLNK